MSDEVEAFKASRESRAGVAHRAGQSSGHTDIVHRLVEAAVYRDTHRTESQESTEDNATGDADG